MQLELNFDFGSEKQGANQVDKILTQVQQVLARNKSVPDYIKQAVWLQELDQNNIVVIDKAGKYRFAVRPTSKATITKLMMVEHALKYEEQGRDRLNDLLTFQNILNSTSLYDWCQLMDNFFKQFGLRPVMTPGAYQYLNKAVRNFQRILTPFDFEIPHAWQDISRDKVGEVDGPFIQEVYSHEVKVYKKKMAELGWTNPNNEFCLRDFQIDDAARGACKPVNFLSHDMGIGKTCIAIAMAHMHGHKRVLVTAPAISLNSETSGWKYELSRMGVPECNIHIVQGPEDLPSPGSEIPSRRPHFYLVDYDTLAKEKWVYHDFTCYGCHRHIPAERKGICTYDGMVSKRQNQYPYGWKRVPARIHCLNLEANGKYCPQCYDDYYRTYGNPGVKTMDRLKKSWHGNYCSECGWKLKTREAFKGRLNKGLTEVKPIWKKIRRGMFPYGIFDESHMMKSVKARRGRAPQMIKGFKRVTIMTGTIMENLVSDVYWQYMRLYHHGLFPFDGELQDYASYVGGKKTGQERYRRVFERNIDAGRHGKLTSIGNEQTFWDSMATIQIRRREDDPDVNAQIQLPPVEHHQELLDMDPYHKAIYDMSTGDFQRAVLAALTKEHGKDYTKDLKVEDLAPIQPAQLQGQLQILRQIAACPEQSGAYEDKVTTKDQRLLEILKPEISDGHRVVVFTSWQTMNRRLVDFLEDQGMRVMRIDGTRTKSEKWLNIDAWRTENKWDVMVASIKSMGVAVNLPPLTDDFHCKTAVFMCPEWVPGKMRQAWKRVHRQGQTQPCSIWWLYHKDSIEERIGRMLGKKEQATTTAIDRVKVEDQFEDQAVHKTYQELTLQIMQETVDV